MASLSPRSEPVAARRAATTVRGAALVGLKPHLERLYSSFNYPDSAADPVQFLRPFDDVRDREVVGFIASALAFGRVASVMASVASVLSTVGPRPAEYVRRFDARVDGPRYHGFVHRWTRGRDVVALLCILRHMLVEHGSVEEFFAAGCDARDADVTRALESFSQRALAVDLRAVYGPVRPRPGVAYFFSRPSTGGACKRLSLFLRWMVRRDAIDPGGWTRVAARQLVVPLDTHIIRVARCLRLTRYASPGWRMAADITSTLRLLDADDPVRYDFAMCHLGMMNACGYARPSLNRGCPLKQVCRPAAPPRRAARTPPPSPAPSDRRRIVR
ncbi:MAG: TIGR02757 family protein [Vicinamibacterales bacterium]